MEFVFSNFDCCILRTLSCPVLSCPDDIVLSCPVLLFREDTLLHCAVLSCPVLSCPDDTWHLTPDPDTWHLTPDTPRGYSNQFPSPDNSLHSIDPMLRQCYLQDERLLRQVLFNFSALQYTTGSTSTTRCWTVWLSARPTTPSATVAATCTSRWHQTNILSWLHEWCV